MTIKDGVVKLSKHDCDRIIKEMDKGVPMPFAIGNQAANNGFTINRPIEGIVFSADYEGTKLGKAIRDTYGSLAKTY